jgi:polysaccharide deacetylase family protein (PEP-CTERM system associated)
MKNALTIDLEDYYHVSAFNGEAASNDWNTKESRVSRNTDAILGLLAEANCKATFFTLGWVAEEHPALIKKIAGLGHEIACHSLRHRTVYEMTPEEFREDTHRAKELLEDCAGVPVRGYRAPSFSITQDSAWAFGILAELGFAFDSSVFPVKHPNYGAPEASRHPFRIQTISGPLVEFPMTTLEFAGLRSPFGGGAYFRLLPYWYTKWGVSFLNRHEDRPVCFYLHPWEIDPAQPRMSGSLTSLLRHYMGLRNAPAKFRSLVFDFEFCPLGSLIDSVQ